MSEKPEIPLDVQILLKDCILSIFWMKRDILDFFKSVGCPKDILEGPEKTQTALTRFAIVNSVFYNLCAEEHRGYTVFQSMIDSLQSWSHFDPYWFDQKQKLDRAIAQKAISDLNSAIEKRNSATRRQKTQREKFTHLNKKGHDISALERIFHKIYGDDLSPQAKGKLFEDFLRKLFIWNDIRLSEPFNLIGEQIDGSFKFEGENYIVEAKWQDAATSTSDLYSFAHKVDGKMHGRGIFISANGFSNQAIESIVTGKHIQTILIDGRDIVQVLEERLTLSAMLDAKIRAAQIRGDVYICAVTGKNRI